MAPRTREEKERFFADLDRLDHLDELEDDEEEPRKPVNRPALGFTKTLSTAEPSTRKRKPSTARPDSGPSSSSAPSGLEPPRPSTADATIPTPRPVSPPALRRTQSEAGRPFLKQKRVKAKKGEPVLVAPEDRIFNSLVFFFIPNSDANPVNKRRIINAISRGATWARSWKEPITHVIIDKSLDISRALREFPDGRLLPETPVVTDDWPVECIKYQTLNSPAWSRFRVRGMISPFQLKDAVNGSEKRTDVPEIPESEDEVTTAEKKSENSKNQGSDSRTSAQQSKKEVKQAASITKDELDDIIATVQRVGEIPASMFEDDELSATPETSFSSSFRATATPTENRGFLCMELNDGNRISNPNAQTMDALQMLATHFDEVQDVFRTRAYRMAKNALGKQQAQIRTYKEAIALPGIGPSIAAKIEELVETKRIRRLDYAKADPMDQLRRLFMGVYGAGYVQAQQWIAQGYRTLRDLETHADLTPNQKIGIEHYDNFQQRIPREEVAKHADVVRSALKSADKDLEAVVGGSYRRGSPDSGDIDLLITKEDASMEHIRTLVMETVVPQLTKQGFLKAALASGRRSDNGSKWHGASALPGNDSPWRRLDLLFVPPDELGAALIYFTGNDIFNRSIRLLANRKGMRLNQHGLFKNVMRGPKRLKITEGELVEGRDERKIFELLEYHSDHQSTGIADGSLELESLFTTLDILNSHRCRQVCEHLRK